MTSKFKLKFSIGRLDIFYVKCSPFSKIALTIQSNTKGVIKSKAHIMCFWFYSYISRPFKVNVYWILLFRKSCVCVYFWENDYFHQDIILLIKSHLFHIKFYVLRWFKRYYLQIVYRSVLWKKILRFRDSKSLFLSSCWW
jgi:hypothetical protein